MNRLALIIIVCAIAACSREPEATQGASPSAKGGVSASPKSTKPLHTQLEVFMELRDPVTGASTEAHVQPNVEMLTEGSKNSIKGDVTVGNGASRAATLRYVESTATEDHYALTIARSSTRKHTAGSSSTSSSSERQVAYAGVAREVWADDVSRIVLQPIPSKN